MKNFISVLLLFVITTVSCAQTNAIENFSWLLGDWQRTNNQAGKLTSESWKFSEQKYQGLGVTVVDSDTVFYENMALTNIENTLYLVVNTPQHEKPVHFKITAQSKDSFTAENPDNDFPKKIHYQKNNEGLKAIISGGGKDIEFIFKKAKD
jgi:hypothetical protein